MKKLATLMLAAGMVLGSFAGAEAIDWKVKGEWIFQFGVSDGIKMVRRDRDGNKRYGNTNSQDNFNAVQRVRLQIDAVASETLSGQVYFEIGDSHWGRLNQGAGMNADQIVVEVKRAFIDWIVPSTDLRVRMGVQGLALPSYTFGTGVFEEDVAAVTATYKFNDNVSLTAFWARPLNDNAPAVVGRRAGQDNRNFYSKQAFYMDNLDVFGLILPLSFDGFKITPWGAIAAVGPDAFRDAWVDGTNAAGVAAAGWGSPGTRNTNGVFRDMAPAYFNTGRVQAGTNGPLARINRSYATAWWAGLTGEITAADPFRIAWDANYGSIQYDKTKFLNRHGWFINVLAEYKLDWGVPGLYFWWGSGDDSNPSNGSERMPYMGNTNQNMKLSNFGFNGHYWDAVGDGRTGLDHTGTWGIGARIRDMSFIEDLKHTLRVNFFGGTNSPAMAKWITGKKWRNGPRAEGGLQTDFQTGFGSSDAATMYLTTQDYGLEINFENVYKIYENLDMMVEVGYIHLWLDQSQAVWGAKRDVGVRGVNVTDAINANIFFRYSF